MIHRLVRMTLLSESTETEEKASQRVSDDTKRKGSQRIKCSVQMEALHGTKNTKGSDWQLLWFARFELFLRQHQELHADVSLVCHELNFTATCRLYIHIYASGGFGGVGGKVTKIISSHPLKNVNIHRKVHMAQ